MNETAEKKIWTSHNRAESDVIISTRVRIARNFASRNFVHQESAMEQEENIKIVADALAQTSAFENSSFYKLWETDSLSRKVFFERNLISEENADRRAIFIDDSECLSVLVNEEDHLRLQSILGGFQPKKAYAMVNNLELILEKEIDFAFDEEYGYLTPGPFVGTAMRASFMFHCPALVWFYKRRFESLILDVIRHGAIVRGFKGDDSEAVGDMIQISNQITLGASEDEIFESLRFLAERLAYSERLAREKIYTKDSILIEDRVYRAIAILRHASYMSYEEMCEHLSWIRLGVSLELLDIPFQVLTEMAFFLQNAHLAGKIDGKENKRDIDIQRSVYIKEMIGNYN